jgi:hypothetical protein
MFRSSYVNWQRLWRCEMLEVIRADITTLQVDVIVNAANSVKLSRSTLLFNAD